MRALEIATAGPYNSFLLLAIGTGFIIACRDGRRYQAPAPVWLALLGLTIAAGLLGSRLLHFDGAAVSGAKTILGGVLLGTLALLGGARFLRLDPRSADALAVALPVGLAVGRVGCLLAGCCFGHPTDLPWGAIYDPHSPAFRAQLDAGLIGSDAGESLPVHPTQLYEAGLALLVAGAVPRVRRRLRGQGSVLLAVLVMLMLGRITLESFRARDAAVVAGLTQIQWALAAAAIATALLLLIRERSIQRAAPHAHRASLLRPAVVACIAPAVLVAGGAFFAPLERLVLVLVAVPPVIAVLLPLSHRIASRRQALAMPALVPCAALAMALQQTPDPERDGSYPRTEWGLGLSFATNRELEDRVVGSFINDCGDEIDVTEEFEVRRTVAGGSLYHTKRASPDRASTIRLRGFAGSERSTSRGTVANGESTTLGGLGTSATLDFRWVGVTAGVGAGRFTGDTTHSAIVGTGGVRIGRLDGLHAFGGINDLEPLGHSENAMRVGVGYGLPNGAAVRAGVWRGEAAFVGGTFRVGGFELEPHLALGDDYDVRLGISRRFRLTPRD